MRPQLCATGLSFVLSLSFLSLILSLNTGVQGATLREPRPWGNELDTFRRGSQALQPPPSAAMLQALQYIQSLSQRTPQDPAPNDDKPAVSDDDLGDVERVRAMLQLAAPARTSAGLPKSRGEEEERDGEETKEEDKGQQWIQAVLSTLQQTEDQSPPLKTPHRASGHFSTPARPLFTLPPASEPRQQQDGQTDVGDYGRSSSWANQGVRRRHRKLPLMFDEQGDERPLKRSNENAEEQYTPQKLATLQSVFDELSRIVDSKAESKQSAEGGEGENEDNDGYREKKMLFGDGEEEELMPLEEKTEQEEEETQRREFKDGFGDDEDEDERDEEPERDNEDKRSNRSDFLETEKLEDPDDFSRLVDYYLMKALEKTEQEEQKRDQEEEEEEDEEEEEEEEDEPRDKRRAAQPQYGVDPRSVYQLLQISRKLQIPPEDILDLLEHEQSRKLGKSWQRKPALSRTPSASFGSSYEHPATALYRRPPEAAKTSSVTQDILRILGLASAAQPNNKSPLRPIRYKSSPALSYYMSERELPDYSFSENSRDQREDDYDDTVGEDELAAYLLTQRQRRSREPAEEYFVRGVDSVPETTQAEREDTAGNPDEETLLRFLNFLNPESEDTDETHIGGKTVM